MTILYDVIGKIMMYHVVTPSKFRDARLSNPCLRYPHGPEPKKVSLEMLNFSANEAVPSSFEWIGLGRGIITGNNPN